MTPDEWKERIGDRVAQRRRDRGYTSKRQAARAAGVSEATWRSVESGKRQPAKGVVVVPTVGGEAQPAICRALGWTDDSFERLARGDEPEDRLEETSAPVLDRVDAIDARLTVLEDHVDELLRRLPPAEPAQ